MEEHKRERDPEREMEGFMLDSCHLWYFKTKKVLNLIVLFEMICVVVCNNVPKANILFK